MYATAIKREQKIMQKQFAKRKPHEVASSDNKSNSDVSLQYIEPPKSRKSSTKSKTRTDERTLRSVAHKKRAQKAETLQEEMAYQEKVQWLIDHGESDKDEPVDGQSDTDSTAS
jgi:carboxypeptidase C (cathepsin A)